MLGAVSPYDIHARSPAFMAAALLADTLYTLFPEPGDAGLVQADGGDPSWRAEYDRLIDSIRWTAPLWREGVISTGNETASVLSGFQRATSAEAGIRWPARLESLIARRRDAPTDDVLGSLCRDIRLGGVTPSVMLPVTLALDRFAATNDVLRFEESRENGRPTQRRQRTPALAAFPILLETGADQVLEIREQLGEELEAVRQATADIAAADPETRPGEDPHAAGRLNRSIEAYRDAFARYLDVEPAIRSESRPAMASMAIGVRSADTSVEFAERIMARPAEHAQGERTTPPEAEVAPLECTFIRMKRLPWQV